MSFITRISILLSFWLVSFAAFGQSQAKLAPTTNDTCLLWRISGNGLATSSYLFGTIHMIPTEDYFLPASVSKALKASEQVAFEIDPRDMENPAVLMSLMSRINMNNDTTLSDLLSKDDYQLVSDYFEKSGMPMMLFKRMKPLFLSAMVGQDMGQMMNGGLGGNANIKSYELELTRMAEAGEKNISGLETIEFQLSLFDSIPYKAQAQMLLTAIKADQEGVEGEDQFAEMVDMYKRQAIAEMANMISAESTEVSHFEELLLTRRNESWIEPMSTMMKEKPSFFAVGAGHLAGEKGVIALLRKTGYTVEAVYK